MSKRTYYLWRYGGVTQRRYYSGWAVGDTIIATVRARTNDEAWCLFQDRNESVKRIEGV